MKRVLMLCLFVSINASADVYKCSKGGRPIYQSKPCDIDEPDRNKVKVKQSTPEQEAAAKEKLKEIEAHNAAYKENQAKKEQEAFEKSMKISTVKVMQNDAREQQRQSGALEKQAQKPPVSGGAR